jgi:alpha-mannosidase
MLNGEWLDRINRWLKELKLHFYRKLGDVELSGFATFDQLTPQQAGKGKFKPMPSGTKWGAKWQYAWFKAALKLPAEAKGQRIVFRPCAFDFEWGMEGLAFVDGKCRQAIDFAHQEILLASPARGGEKFNVLIEAYAGHGPMVCDGGPVSLDRQTVPEPPPRQRAIGASSFGVWQEDAFQLWLDANALLQLRNNIEPDSLRVAKIDAGLRDFTLIADLELPADEMLGTLRAARKRLAPLLASRNGDTVPTLHCWGHGHLDVAWLWPLAETQRKTARTFANQLELAAMYPRHRFMQSQAELYDMCKRLYPELYSRVKKAVAKGTIIADGGMWVEADTNIAGGEALIRQFLLGKEFFGRELGVDCKVLWLPDVFGYSGALPQILRGCGIDYFATAKIFWKYHGGQDFPFNSFQWEGIDGTSVLAHLFNNYNSFTDPGATIGQWKRRVQKDDIETKIMSFGYGDGGGGPNREHVEYMLRQADLEGAPRCVYSSPREFFEDLKKRDFGDNRYVGELYFQAHRGTYTTQARTKRGNRKSEFALREAEAWASVASAVGGFKVPAEELDSAWKKLLVNQFHDILPGSSIHRVYEEAEKTFDEVIDASAEIADDAARCVAGVSPARGEAVPALRKSRGAGSEASALMVFNSLNWPRVMLVELPRGFDSATDSSGNALRTQKIGGRTVAQIEVPSFGYATILPGRVQWHARTGREFVRACEPTKLMDKMPMPQNATAALGQLKATPTLLENEFLRLRFDGRGQITSIWDKLADRELAAGSCNCFKMYKDVPSMWDAWDIDSVYKLTPVELAVPARVEVLAQGPLIAGLRITRMLNNSPMSQEVSLASGSRRVDFTTSIDWRERHKMLKVGFEVDIHASEALHEIQFGHVRRPNHASNVFDADRFEVTNHKWSALCEGGRGFGVLNDCKYGLNVTGKSINLTLLRSPLAPDQTADLGPQEFTYAIYPFTGPLVCSQLVREGYELNVSPLVVEGGTRRGGPVSSSAYPGRERAEEAHGQDAHVTDGVADVPSARSFLQTDSPAIIVEAVKPAQDGSGDIILRLYESLGTTARCMLQTALGATSATGCNMLEEPQRAIRVNKGRIALQFRPFEIKTLRLTK